jgi:nitric oxide reductase activation protein
MAAVASTTVMNATLSQWLRLLWNIAPPLQLNSDRPYITAGTIHLPARDDWRQHTAAAAHAAAHLTYSPPSFDGGGLGAIARALMALLEDARVEALAMRELPGLARLWRPLHTATPDIGSDFEALMQRLARALVDPGYHDTNPWVCKGRALFCSEAYPGTQLQLSVLQTPADVRRAAMLLGHDIGQMRLQFNAKMYSPMPAYRDDHRWMWSADVLHVAPPPATVAASGSRDDDDSALDVTDTVTRYPEWDRLISRLRPDWCRVIEQEKPQTAAQPAIMDDGAIKQTAMRLRISLRPLTRSSFAPQRSEEGELFDPGALVDWRVARRLRNVSDVQVYRGLDRREERAAVCLLIDQSASTAAALGSNGYNILQTAAASAAAIAMALQAVGVACAIAGFSSRGRHAVRVVTVKSLGELADNLMATRLQALQPGGSTRLGAVLRHATSRLAGCQNEMRWVIVLSDGEPHDVDVHDPRYLIEDARHAVTAGARRGVRIGCLVLTHEGRAQAQRIFGRLGAQLVHNLCDLPRAIRRMTAKAY